MTINDEITVMIQNEINNIPRIELATITKVYTNNKFIDCKTDSGGILKYIPIIANNPAKEDKCLLIPLADNKFYTIG